MNTLLKIEHERGVMLPVIYKDFYNQCELSIPPELAGTDILNQHPDLNEGAAEILHENEIANFLNKDDIVFAMHQGYMFWYFKANGDPDPMVYGYFEGNAAPDEFERFSKFIERYM